jgi:hypothetical protein
MARRYVEGLMADVGGADALKPPLPPLARYKRDAVVRLRSQDSSASSSNGSTRPASMLHEQ